MTDSVRDWFGPHGRIAARLPGYEQRREQVELAEAIELALRERRHLLAEAGTGVGKSFAYLLPAVLHACAQRGDGPVVVSTRTIALQQQLERKDLPFLHSVLPLEWTSVTALGRSNYLCLRRLHLAHAERGRLFADAEREQQLLDVMQWSLSTAVGTRQDLPRPVDADVWEEVRAEHGNCLHRACPHYAPCQYQRARRRMDGAQILVVNHALYMADVALRMAGASYLPDHRVVVFDEAHHLERVATEHLGLRLNEAGVRWHLQRLHPRRVQNSLLHSYGSARAGLLWHEADAAVSALFAELDARIEHEGGDTVELPHDTLDDRAAVRLGELGTELLANAATITAVDRQMEMVARAQGLLALQAALGQLAAPPPATTVRWLERDKRGAALCAAPLAIAPALQQWVFGAERTAILVSATLGGSPDPDFGWMRRQLGIATARTLRLGSPFDYARHVRVLVEEAMPDPAREPAAFLAECKPRIRAHVLRNGGRALVLCTSWSFVREIAEHLRGALADAGVPLLVQGEDSLHRLLERKRDEPTSVLVGTDSLWEGIDVPGDALTLVILTRLPFQRPDHPLTRARMRALRREGRDPFAEGSLPEAVLKFRQGFGRLVRTSTDGGTVVVMDPRSRTQPYGARFLAALPAGVVV